MTEFTVSVSDSFDVACPLCKDKEAWQRFTDHVGYATTGLSITCPLCRGKGEVEVHVEGETTVDIEPPERDEP